MRAICDGQDIFHSRELVTCFTACTGEALNLSCKISQANDSFWVAAPQQSLKLKCLSVVSQEIKLV